MFILLVLIASRGCSQHSHKMHNDQLMTGHPETAHSPTVTARTDSEPTNTLHRKSYM